MLRRLLETPARRRSRTTRVAARDLTGEVRTPDPYVWRLPNPHDARWRRWSKRCHIAGRYLPFPREEECWKLPERRPPTATWHTADDVVRPYVLGP